MKRIVVECYCDHPDGCTAKGRVTLKFAAGTGSIQMEPHFQGTSRHPNLLDWNQTKTFLVELESEQPKGWCQFDSVLLCPKHSAEEWARRE